MIVIDHFPLSKMYYDKLAALHRDLNNSAGRDGKRFLNTYRVHFTLPPHFYRMFTDLLDQ